MKLYFEQFKQTYQEFLSLAELTTEILQSMGVILRQISGGRATGIVNNRFMEFDDDE